MTASKQITLCLACAAAFSGLAAGMERDATLFYQVEWDSPSADHNGSMPLGNGQVAVNAWVDPEGNLHLLLARDDAWDEYGRLLKVGGLRFWVGKSSPATTQHFRQRLTVRDATLTAAFGPDQPEIEFRVWVDAHRPIVYVEIITQRPSEAFTQLALWRTQVETLSSTEASDVLHRNPAGEVMVIEPDVVLPDQPEGFVSAAVGWYRHNRKSVGPELCARIQGVADFPRRDPLLHRTFGAVVTAAGAHRVDQSTLKRQPACEHRFEVVVHTSWPSTPEAWLQEAANICREASRIPWHIRRREHEDWWRSFWERSYIHIWPSKKTTGNSPARPESTTALSRLLPRNAHLLRIGSDQAGGSRFAGRLGRVSVWAKALPAEMVEKLSRIGVDEKIPTDWEPLVSLCPAEPTVLPSLADVNFGQGLTVEAWVYFPQSPSVGGRIVDKITPGGGDGFLVDFYPGSRLRCIVGKHWVQLPTDLPPQTWHHVAVVVTSDGTARLFLQGKLVLEKNLGDELAALPETFIVARAYALQRFINACTGRGRYPIKFNGSLFTVPAAGKPAYADYRRWGPGYWWQNTRLPYYAMCAAGDFDLMKPLFTMYVDDLMPLFEFRTRRYFGHGGAFIPECIYFWGDVFSATYGWTPFELREDKLQENRYHKWLWVTGLELVWLLLDYWEHTEDHAFLRAKVLPTADKVLRFFDEHYPVGPDGKMYMYPAQALETWWDCVNPMPEVAGLHAVLGRLLTISPEFVLPEEREYWRRLHGRIPDIPLRTFEDGSVALAPAQEFRNKQNIEAPELYAVFPFRLFTWNKPNVAWATVAAEQRSHRAWIGWHQDDIVLAYLGQAEEARRYVVKRAATKDPSQRFPAFWGPNHDWTPDQTHGGVLMKALQSMLLQTDGEKIYLLPAWPTDWDVDFRLWAPYRTTVEARVRSGQLVELQVHPEKHRKDVEIARQVPVAR